MMAGWEDRYWTADDGVKLHARDYPGSAARPAVVCIPGLTRNARDFDELAQRLAGKWRVVAVDLRGRGESGAAKDPASYRPATYLADLEAMLAEMDVTRFVAVGSSLGGVVLLMLAAADPARLAGAVLNDIGPEIEPAGLQRIRSHVGRGSSHPTWMHAARAVAEAQREVYPDWDVLQWLAMAKRLYRLTASGKIALDHDGKIAEPFRSEPPPELWAELAALREVPTLIVRGARSDVLAAVTAARMVAMLPSAELVDVPGVGHAPTMAEPVAAAALDRLLARVAGA